MGYEEHIKLQLKRKEELKAKLDDLLKNKSEITLELGSGHGHYLTAYAQTHPNETCIGIDIIRDRVERANKKAQNHNLHNLHFLLAEANMLFEVLPKDIKINKLFILFLDPWPKKRHFKNRLIQKDFLTMISNILVPGAKLYFRTDHEGYFDWTVEHLQEHSSWKILENEPWLFEAGSVFQEKMGTFQSLIAQNLNKTAATEQ